MARAQKTRLATVTKGEDAVRMSGDADVGQHRCSEDDESSRFSQTAYKGPSPHGRRNAELKVKVPGRRAHCAVFSLPDA